MRRRSEERDPDCGMCTGNAGLLAICDRCAKNLEMLDLADEAAELRGVETDIVGFPTLLTESAPEGSLFIIPSRASLERALEHDEAPDLRRYFGVITNIGY